MASGMPGPAEIQNLLRSGFHASNQDIVRQLRDEEQRGRLLRDNKLSEICVVQADFVGTFSEDASGMSQTVSNWLEFGKIHFTARPIMVTGSERLAQSSEAPLNSEASNYDPDEYETVPCMGMVLKWRVTDRGLYTASKVIAFTIGMVTNGYQARICCLFAGPGIRMA